MTNEIHCKMYKQMYWGKIFYLKGFSLLLQFLLIEEGNCNNSDRSHQIAVKSIAIEIISHTCALERKQLISVHYAAVAEFSLTRGRGGRGEEITISFKYFKELSLTCLASQEPISSLPLAGSFHSQTSGMIHNWTKLSVVWRREQKSQEFVLLPFLFSYTRNESRSNCWKAKHFQEAQLPFWLHCQIPVPLIIPSYSLLRGRSWDFCEKIVKLSVSEQEGKNRAWKQQ